jgi:uncharacterized protein YukE
VSTIPSNYDSTVVDVDPSSIEMSADAIQIAVVEVSQSLNVIMNTLSGLALSWTGESADVANKFNTLWSNAMTSLFGTKDDPDIGILSAVVSGMKGAVQNYSASEQQVVDMFNQLKSSMSDPASNIQGIGNVVPTQESIDDNDHDGAFTPNDNTTSGFQKTSVNEFDSIDPTSGDGYTTPITLGK